MSSDRAPSQRASSEVAIRAENLSKSYKLAHARRTATTLAEALISRLRHPLRKREDTETFWALRDVSFEVAHGEVIGVVGRNGAGKSTLLKVLSRITPPTSGRVELFGRVGSLLEVGTGFHRELTGRENIYLNGAVLGMRRSDIERQFDAIIDFAGVEKFLDTPVKHYSSGMYVRLAFAVAAHLEPEILIVDEVLAVGDAEFQKKCLGKMKDVARGGRTVLFVSHNMGAVSGLCNKAILMAEGRVKLIGSVESVVAEYLRRDAGAGGEEVDVANHPNRTAKYKPLITRLRMEALDGTSANGSAGGVAYCGRPLRLRIGYDLPDRVNCPEFVVRFHTAMGFKVFTLISSYQDSTLPQSLQGRGEVVCEIPSLPLMPGEYSLGVRLWQPGQMLDEVENVAALQVEWLDRSVGQFNWNSTHGAVYVNASWRPGEYDPPADTRKEIAVGSVL